MPNHFSRKIQVVKSMVNEKVLQGDFIKDSGQTSDKPQNPSKIMEHPVRS